MSFITMTRLWPLVALLFIVGATPVAASDPDLPKLQHDLIAPWLVEVHGESRTRTLRLKGADRRADGLWNLDADYGWSDGRQTPIRAEVELSAKGYRLTLTTQASSLITAEGAGDGTLTGTFTLKSGNVKPIKLTRVTDDFLVQLRADATSAQAKAVLSPGPDVPAECASLVGGWNGTWSSWNVGEEWLWVVHVDAQCVVKYRFGRSGYWGPFSTAPVQNGVLSTPCADGGTCSFERHGDDLWGSWRGMAGSNSIVLKKISANPK